MPTSNRITLHPIPGSYEERLQTAQAHAKRGQADQAIAIYQRLIERLGDLPERRRQPNSVAGSLLIVAAAELQDLYASQGRYEDSIALCQQLVDWDAESTDHWRQRICVWQIANGQVETGLEGLRTLAEGDPDELENWMTLADEATQAGRVELADMALDRALALAAETGDPQDLSDVFLQRFLLEGQRQCWEEACEAWDQAVALDEAALDNLEPVIRILLGAGRLEETQRYIDDDELGKPTATYYRALLAHRRGDRVRAKYLWRQVIKTKTQRASDSVVIRALAHCHLQEPLKALSTLLHDVQVGRQITPRHAQALALAWAMEGELQSALTNIKLVAQDRSSDLAGLPGRLGWQEFDELVKDKAIKEALRPFFAEQS